jgi:NitT/TauT family transport system ATP-binding protein
VTALIAATNVSFSYQNRGATIRILENLNLEIKDGECYCLLGPSGAGKTTVLRLFAGFHFPDSGDLMLEGSQIVGPSAERSVVFQGDDSLFDWLNALDNIAFGLHLRGIDKKTRYSIARKFLDLVGLQGQGEKYPSELSGGMKQRVQIARVLANDPKVLLMDEPFGAVDAQTRSELQDELIRIWSETNKTIFFITHDISEAILLGDRIGVMRSGPASGIRETFEVGLPRPRNRATAGFGELYEKINDVIKAEGKLARGL